MKLTKASKKYHIQTAGQARCPFCKADFYETNTISGDVEYEDFEPVEDGHIEQVAKCRKCNKRWKDVFQLVDIRGLA